MPTTAQVVAGLSPTRPFIHQNLPVVLLSCPRLISMHVHLNLQLAFCLHESPHALMSAYASLTLSLHPLLSSNCSKNACSLEVDCCPLPTHPPHTYTNSSCQGGVTLPRLTKQFIHHLPNQLIGQPTQVHFCTLTRPRLLPPYVGPSRWFFDSPINSSCMRPYLANFPFRFFDSPSNSLHHHTTHCFITLRGAFNRMHPLIVSWSVLCHHL